MDRRRILTFEDGQRTERIEIFIMAVDPQHRPRYSNKPERASIYDDFKLNKPFGLHDLYDIFQRFNC